MFVPGATMSGFTRRWLSAGAGAAPTAGSSTRPRSLNIAMWSALSDTGCPLLGALSPATSPNRPVAGSTTAGGSVNALYVCVIPSFVTFSLAPTVTTFFASPCTPIVPWSSTPSAGAMSRSLFPAANSTRSSGLR